MNVAFLDWQLEIECPNCNKDIDLISYECNNAGNEFSEPIFTNRWDTLKGYPIVCPHCLHEFKIDQVVN